MRQISHHVECHCYVDIVCVCLCVQLFFSYFCAPWIKFFSYSLDCFFFMIIIIIITFVCVFLGYFLELICAVTSMYRNPIYIYNIHIYLYILLYIIFNCFFFFFWPLRWTLDEFFFRTSWNRMWSVPAVRPSNWHTRQSSTLFQ